MSEIYLITIIIISALFFSMQFIPQKKAGDMEDPKLFNFSMGIGILIGCSILLLILSFIFGLSIYHIYPIMISLLAGFIWQFGNAFIITSVMEIGMGQTTVLMNLTTVFSFIFGIIFFSEYPSFIGLIGFFCIIGGTLLISLIKKGEESSSKKSIKGILIMIAGTFIISIFNALSLESMNSVTMPSVPYYVSCFFVGIGIVLGNFILHALIPGNLKKWWNLEPRIHKLGLQSGLYWSVGIILISFALVLGGIGFGISIVQAFILIFGALLAILYFKELIDKKNLVIFIIGSAITISGIIFFSI